MLTASLIVVALAAIPPQSPTISVPPPQHSDAAVAPAPTPDSNSYLYDDGSIETGAAINADADLCWIHEFDAIGGADTIVRVSTAFGVTGFPGSAPPDGTPVILCVWDDPNEDGDPTDAVLVSNITDVVKQGATGTIVDYAVPPASVTGKFFVGVVLTVNATHVAAPIDANTTLFGRAWVAAALPPGTFNVTNLALNQIPPLTLSSLGVDIPWVLRAEGFIPPAVYCTAKINSLGCTPSIDFSGTPDPNSSSGFRVYASNVRSWRHGLLLYSIDGRAATAFQGGTLCMNAPLRRTPLVNSGGNIAGTDCTGVWLIDMNGFAQHTYGGSPAPELLLEGTVVNVQWWGRDKGDPAGFDSSLSNALEYVVPASQPQE